MSHFFLEGFENKWTLIRETPHSQRFCVLTSKGRELSVDIHFTNPKVLTVTVILVGTHDDFSKSWLTPLMDEIAKLALTRDDYAMIDYTLAATPKIIDGNYSVDKEARAHWKL